MPHKISVTLFVDTAARCVSKLESPSHKNEPPVAMSKPKPPSGFAIRQEPHCGALLCSDRVQLRCLWQACSGAASWLDGLLGHAIYCFGCGHRRSTATSVSTGKLVYRTAGVQEVRWFRNLRRVTFGLWFGLFAWDSGIQDVQYGGSVCKLRVERTGFSDERIPVRTITFHGSCRVYRVLHCWEPVHHYD